MNKVILKDSYMLDENIQEVCIFPHGYFSTSLQDEPFLFNSKSAEEVLKIWKDIGNDIVIDYEHQTLSDNKAPAAGWIKSLRFIPLRGLVATVEWTAGALQYFENKEYKYFSPVFTTVDNRVTELINVGLTNLPATKHMQPLVAKKIVAKRDLIMINSIKVCEQAVNSLPDLSSLGDSLEQILDSINEGNREDVANLLQANPDITVDQLKALIKMIWSMREHMRNDLMAQDEDDVGTINPINAPGGTGGSGGGGIGGHGETKRILTEINTKLNLPESDDLDKTIETIKLHLQNPIGFVKNTEYEALTKTLNEREELHKQERDNLDKKIKELKNENHKFEFEELISAEPHAGKISPYMKQWAWETFSKDAEFFKQWIAKAPVIAPPKSILRSTKQSVDDSTLERTMVIQTAKAEYEEMDAYKRSRFSLSNWINTSLKDGKLDLLSAKEKKLLDNKE